MGIGRRLVRRVCPSGELEAYSVIAIATGPQVVDAGKGGEEGADEAL